MKFVFSLCLLTIIMSGCQDPVHNTRTGLVVEFPKIDGPIAITSGNEEHLFASYYGINSWSGDQRYATVLQTVVRNSIPTEDEPATLGLVDMETYEFIPLTETRAWNFQQGCMAHWLGTSPDSLIIYNDVRDGKSISVVLNVHTREELRTFPHPISAVSPDGTKAVSINFSRIRLTRPDYGYGGDGQDARKDVQFPEDDGLFLMDLENGSSELLVSIADVRDMVPEIPEDGLEYFNHTLFSRDGSKVFWLARAIPQRNTTALTVNTDGSQLQRCFPDGWDGSHFDWLSGDELMVTAKYDAKQYAHVLFTVGEDNYRRLGNGLLDYDGHGAFSPDGKWMITDTYPSSGAREQKIYLMDMETETVLPLGRFHHSEEYGGGARCDIHCRWSPNGDLIGFNSTHEGSRQVYVFRLE